MARKYAVGQIQGLAGQVATHVDGELILPGDALPPGTETFDLTYWYYPTPADIAAGASPNRRYQVVLYDVPISMSNADIRREILALRAEKRAQQQWDSDPTERIFD